MKILFGKACLKKQNSIKISKIEAKISLDDKGLRLLSELFENFECLKTGLSEI